MTISGPFFLEEIFRNGEMLYCLKNPKQLCH